MTSGYPGSGWYSSGVERAKVKITGSISALFILLSAAKLKNK